MTSEEIVELTDRAERANRRAIRWLGAIAVLSLTLAFVGFFLGVRGIRHDQQDTQNNRERIADIEQSRDESSRALCIQTNVLIDGARASLVGGLDALLAMSSEITPEQKQQILMTYGDAVAVHLPFRDCSPSGIEEFITHPPPDPGAG